MENQFSSYFIQEIWNKFSQDERIEIIRTTIWQGLSEYEAEREQGDSIADFAFELEPQGIHAVIENFNGQNSKEECPTPMIMKFLDVFGSMQKKKIFIPELNKTVTFTLSAKAIKTINKNGAYQTLKKAGLI